MTRKILITSLIVLVTALTAAIWGYSYIKAPTVENTVGGTSTEESSSETPDVEVDLQGGFEAEGENGEGVFTICVDECGNGVCQPAQECTDLNCVCPETKQECSQDCK